MLDALHDIFSSPFHLDWVANILSEPELIKRNRVQWLGTVSVICSWVVRSWEEKSIIDAFFFFVALGISN